MPGTRAWNMARNTSANKPHMCTIYKLPHWGVRPHIFAAGKTTNPRHFDPQSVAIDTHAWQQCRIAACSDKEQALVSASLYLGDAST